MIRLFIIAITLGFLSSCTTTKTQELGELVEQGAYVAAKLKRSEALIEIAVPKPGTDPVQNEIKEVDIRLIPKDVLLGQVLGVLKEEISVRKADSEDSLNYLAGTASLKKGKYVLYADYGRFFVDDVVDSQGKYIGDMRVGIGFRVRAEITTKKSGVDLSSLWKLGVAFSRNEVEGSLEQELVGVTGSDVDQLFDSLGGDLDGSTILSIMENRGVIKSKLRDPSTNLIPHNLAFASINKSKTEEVKAELTSAGEAPAR